MKKILIAFLFGKLIEKIIDDGMKENMWYEVRSIQNVFLVWIIKNIPVIGKYY